MADASAVLEFWLNEVGPKGWYKADTEVDEAIRRRFGALPAAALAGELDAWAETGEGALALIIVLDQFPRNLHRDSGEAFACDLKAREIAADALDRGYDLAAKGPKRAFFYMPFEHSEELADQELSVRLFEERMPDSAEFIKHAHAHREVIRRFGRFPHRNAALGRESRDEEVRYLAEGGYQPGAKPADEPDVDA